MPKDILSDVCGHQLDEQQQNAIKSNNDYLLVLAAAGAGKTLTIIGKIRYLLEKENLKAEDILCISFTNEATISLKEKLLNTYNYDIEVLTFHKLALKILSNQNNLNIAKDDELNIVIKIFLDSQILCYPFLVTNLLKYYKVSFNKNNYLKKYKLFQKKDTYKALIKTITTFIELLKANNQSAKDLKKYIYSPLKKGDRSLLFVIYAIYLEYEKELISRGTVDFNDMLTLAIKNLPNFKTNYKYIIVDEYQDTSFLRYELLNKLCDKAKAKLMVVGDDWQSIYRFNGCSLKIFLDFPKYFHNGQIIKITHTYRNPQSLINIASFFIMRNPYQLSKELIANKDLTNPLIYVYYKKIKKDFTALVTKISLEGSLFILGRNNFDIFKYLDLNIFTIDQDGYITFKGNNSNIRFLTVHKAKGLESDNVIIINLENSFYGFPNKMLNEPILKYVSLDDDYPYAEERRLFYVALTRSLNRVYFYVDKSKESVFAKEIKKIEIKKRKLKKNL